MSYPRSYTYKTIKSCLVPHCKTNSEEFPQKLFISVPPKLERRIRWFKALGLDNQKLYTKGIHCCEDHFDLQNDADNWIHFKTCGTRLRMKPDAVPHKNLVPIKTEPGIKIEPGTEPEPVTESQLTESDKKRREEFLQKLREQQNAKAAAARTLTFEAPSTTLAVLADNSMQTLPTEWILVNNDGLNLGLNNQPVFSSNDQNTEYVICLPPDVEIETEQKKKNVRTVGTQVNIKNKYRSTGMNTKLTRYVDRATSPCFEVKVRAPYRSKAVNTKRIKYVSRETSPCFD